MVSVSFLKVDDMQRNSHFPSICVEHFTGVPSTLFSIAIFHVHCCRYTSLGITCRHIALIGFEMHAISCIGLLTKNIHEWKKT